MNTDMLYNWAIKHKLGLRALEELRQMMGMSCPDTPAPVNGTSEAAVQSAVRLEAANKGVYLWRNNVGVLTDDRGVPVRYGLANDSKKLNETLKSSDLIGWRSIDLGRGMRVAQFVAREVKEAGWTYTGTPHEVAQLNWINLINSQGGDAAFVNGVGTL